MIFIITIVVLIIIAGFIGYKLTDEYTRGFGITIGVIVAIMVSIILMLVDTEVFTQSTVVDKKSCINTVVLSDKNYVDLYKRGTTIRIIAHSDGVRMYKETGTKKGFIFEKSYSKDIIEIPLNLLEYLHERK